VPALLADQDARRAGVFVDFLGTPASTPRGPAVFALRAGVPLFLGTCVPRPGDPGRYLCDVEEVGVERTGELEEDVRRLTAAHAAALAARVRRWPEHYFWQHRRWRTAPPEPAPDGEEGRVSRAERTGPVAGSETGSPAARREPESTADV